MKAARFMVNAFGENTYIIWDDAYREAAIIDPGMAKEHEREKVDKYIADNNLVLKFMLFTHLHADHALGASHIASRYGIEPISSAEENVLGAKIPEQCDMFGLAPAPPVVCAKTIDDGDILNLGDEEIHVLKVPGHSPGGLVFHIPSSNLVFTGDTLFCGSIGRADLLGGDENLLISGIKSKILTLPPDTTVCPGHGDVTDVQTEAQTNYFLR